jgi:hypothetical protein
MINIGDIVKLTLLIYIILCAADAASREPPVLNWIPRSDWINVKTEFGAKGDGSTDDTAAIQSALNSLSDTGDTAGTLYFPPGTYKITDTLTMTNKPFSTLVGHGGTNFGLRFFDPCSGFWTSEFSCQITTVIYLDKAFLYRGLI